jgi:UrcA family protein
MNRNGSNVRSAKFVLLALGGAIVGSAIAAEELTEVVVTARREVTVTAGQSYTGTPIEVISLARRVSYADLDISSASGAAELQKRVNDTAQAACKELDKLYPLTDKDSPACTKKAADAGLAQARAAIAAAPKKPAAK